MTYTSRDYGPTGDAGWLDANIDDQPLSGELTYASAHIDCNRLQETIGRAVHKRAQRAFAHLMQDYPTVPLILTEKRLLIPSIAPDEFMIAIDVDRGCYVLHLGAWRDEFAVAGEAVELIEAALRGDIRIRIDIDARAQHCSAERRLVSGDWVTLPRNDDSAEDALMVGVVRTIYLRKRSSLS
jgi:hypothetical protein